MLSALCGCDGRDTAGRESPDDRDRVEQSYFDPLCLCRCLLRMRPCDCLRGRRVMVVWFVSSYCSFLECGAWSPLSKALTSQRTPDKEPATDPPQLGGPMAGSGNLSKASDDHRTPTAHRPTVPPSGERAVIIIVTIKTVLTLNHLFKPGNSPSCAELTRLA